MHGDGSAESRSVPLNDDGSTKKKRSIFGYVASLVDVPERLVGMLVVGFVVVWTVQGMTIYNEFSLCDTNDWVTVFGALGANLIFAVSVAYTVMMHEPGDHSHVIVKVCCVAVLTVWAVVMIRAKLLLCMTVTLTGQPRYFFIFIVRIIMFGLVAVCMAGTASTSLSYLARCQADKIRTDPRDAFTVSTFSNVAMCVPARSLLMAQMFFVLIMYGWTAMVGGPLNAYHCNTLVSLYSGITWGIVVLGSGFIIYKASTSCYRLDVVKSPAKNHIQLAVFGGYEWIVQAFVFLSIHYRPASCVFGCGGAVCLRQTKLWVALVPLATFCGYLPLKALLHALFPRARLLVLKNETIFQPELDEADELISETLDRVFRKAVTKCDIYDIPTKDKEDAMQRLDQLKFHFQQTLSSFESALIEGKGGQEETSSGALT